MQRWVGAALLGGVAGLPSLNPASYVEPSFEEYWGGGKDQKRPFKEERLRAADLDEVKFRERVLDGSVFVVKDLGAGPMEKWDCAYFASDQLFSQAVAKQEYAAGMEEGGKRHLDLKGKEWQTDAQPSGATEDQDSEAPKIAPYYFGIKEAGFFESEADGLTSDTWKRSMLKKAQEHIRVPPFMTGNEPRMMDSPEFWFSRTGAGAKAHMDVHKEGTVSIQIAGTKRWRLDMMGPRTAAFLGELYMDGAVYNGTEPWNPMYSITLRPGEALFLPPGMIHETLNTGEGEPCSASVTFQYDHPMAARMYRTYMPRVRRTGDMVNTWADIRQWATLHGLDSFEGKGYEAARKEVLSKRGMGMRFMDLDKNRDERLSLAELAEALEYEPEAINTLAFNDLDGDGFVARAECAEVYGLWAATVAAAVADTPKKFRRIQLAEDAEELEPKTRKELLKFGRALEAKRAEL